MSVMIHVWAWPKSQSGFHYLKPMFIMGVKQQKIICHPLDFFKRRYSHTQTHTLTHTHTHTDNTWPRGDRGGVTGSSWESSHHPLGDATVSECGEHWWSTRSTHLSYFGSDEVHSHGRPSRLPSLSPLPLPRPLALCVWKKAAVWGGNMWDIMDPNRYWVIENLACIMCTYTIIY